VNTGAGLAPGFYCFRAEWPGDNNYPTALSEFGGTSGTNECFHVLQIPTTTQTAPSPGAGKSVVFGSTVTDTATVQATQSGDDYPSGSVAFFLCDPGTVATNGGDCHTGGTKFDTETVSAVSPQTTPPSSTATSAATSALKQTGTWCFRAEYTPGPPNGAFYTGSSDGSTGECFVVKDTSTASSMQHWVPNDTGTVSSDNGAPLKGTLTIQLYTGTGCQAANIVTDHVYNKAADGSSNTVTLTTNNTTEYDSDVSWLVSFSSTDPNVGNPTPHCESSSLTVNN
jgi:hypothetical protein